MTDQIYRNYLFYKEKKEKEISLDSFIFIRGWAYMLFKLSFSIIICKNQVISSGEERVWHNLDNFIKPIGLCVSVRYNAHLLSEQFQFYMPSYWNSILPICG